MQTDNGREFTNDPEVTSKKTIFEQKLEEKGIKHIKTRPYSPWQNGKVERIIEKMEENFIIESLRV